MHGLDIVDVISPVSTLLIAETFDNGHLWRQRYSKGEAVTELECVRPAEDDEHGTMIQFQPDFTIFEQHEFSYERLCQRAQELAYLLPKTTWIVRDERGSETQEQTHYSDKGLADYLHELIKDTTTNSLMRIGHLKYPLTHHRYVGDLIVDLAYRYVDSDDTEIHAYMNTVKMTGGTYEAGLFSGLQKESKDNVKQGLVLAMHILHPDPQFKSMEEIELLNPDVEDWVKSLCRKSPQRRDLSKLHQSSMGIIL